MDRPMRLVPVEEHTHVQRAVVLLRLAQALNQDRAQDRATAAVKIRTRVYPKRVTLELLPTRGVAALEAWPLKKEAPSFPEVLRPEPFVDAA